MSDESKKVSKRAGLAIRLSGLAITAGTYYLVYKTNLIPLPSTLGIAERLGYTCKWLLLPGISVLVAVIAVGRKRHEVGAPPLAGKENLIEVQKNILQNTIEQTSIITCGMLALAASAQTPAQMRFIPVAAILFFLSRMAFKIGYEKNPNYRGFGMITNLFNAAFVYGTTLYLNLRYGLLVGLDQ